MRRLIVSFLVIVAAGAVFASDRHDVKMLPVYYQILWKHWGAKVQSEIRDVPRTFGAFLALAFVAKATRSAQNVLLSSLDAPAQDDFGILDQAETAASLYGGRYAEEMARSSHQPAPEGDKEVLRDFVRRGWQGAQSREDYARAMYELLVLINTHSSFPLGRAPNSFVADREYLRMAIFGIMMQMLEDEEREPTPPESTYAPQVVALVDAGLAMLSGETDPAKRPGPFHEVNVQNFIGWLFAPIHPDLMTAAADLFMIDSENTVTLAPGAESLDVDRLERFFTGDDPTEELEQAAKVAARDFPGIAARVFAMGQFRAYDLIHTLKRMTRPSPEDRRHCNQMLSEGRNAPKLGSVN